MTESGTVSKALQDTLDLIDSGRLEATSGERAYIAGAIHGLGGAPIEVN